MSEQRPEYRNPYDEKERAVEEKEVHKHEEKMEEKSFEEKSRQDPVGSMVWAATLIWAGAILLANNLGWLERLSIRLSDQGLDLPFDLGRWAGAWQAFFIGAGILVLIGVVARLLIPRFRRPILGSVIWAVVLFGIAFGRWSLIGPLILIAVGLSIIFGGFARRR